MRTIGCNMEKMLKFIELARDTIPYLEKEDPIAKNLLDKYTC